MFSDTMYMEFNSRNERKGTIDINNKLEQPTLNSLAQCSVDMTSSRAYDEKGVSPQCCSLRTDRWTEVIRCRYQLEDLYHSLLYLNKTLT